MLSKKLYTFIFKLFGSILDETFVLGVVDIFLFLLTLIILIFLRLYKLQLVFNKTKRHTYTKYK